MGGRLSLPRYEKCLPVPQEPHFIAQRVNMFKSRSGRHVTISDAIPARGRHGYRTEPWPMGLLHNSIKLITLVEPFRLDTNQEIREKYENKMITFKFDVRIVFLS